ncbi:helicase [Gregarina niphandrodes]|uniref:ATP-dependent RNA helicase n=1 Tax=Gregarina niphandrodes TaxID=110365 RepID=A0A023BAT7_GRENI|nr:helicase [Gregarina niphandrodes]EZG78604.1 helicase [Gregarina niphandrodes]|eukprot:XP_011129242.1 helicase [Gregarina niphandrodes]
MPRIKKRWHNLSVDPSLLCDGLVGLEICEAPQLVCPQLESPQKRRKKASVTEAAHDDVSDQVPFDPDEAVFEFDEADRLIAESEKKSSGLVPKKKDEVRRGEVRRGEVLLPEVDIERELMADWLTWSLDSLEGVLSPVMKGKVLGASRGLEIPSVILRNLKEMGWLAPTAIQRAVIPLATVCRKDVCIASETGSGKTGAFALPCLIHMLSLWVSCPEAKESGLDTIVLAPTHELARQVNDVLLDLCRGLEVRTELVVGGIMVEKQQRRLTKKRPNIIIATVGRLLALLMGDEDLNIDANPYLSDLSTVRHLIVDEADRMFETGKTKDMQKILQKVQSDKATSGNQTTCQYLIASATLTLAHDMHRTVDRQTVDRQTVDRVKATQSSEISDGHPSDTKNKINAMDIIPFRTKDTEIIDLTTNEFKQQIKAVQELQLPRGIEVYSAVGNYRSKFRYLYTIITRYFAKHFAEKSVVKIIVFANTIDFAKKLCKFAKLVCKDCAAKGDGREYVLRKSTSSNKSTAMKYVPINLLVAGNAAEMKEKNGSRKIAASSVVESSSTLSSVAHTAVMSETDSSPSESTVTSGAASESDEGSEFDGESPCDAASVAASLPNEESGVASGSETLVDAFRRLHVLSLHSQQKQSKRYEVFEKFNRRGESGVLFATDIAARGLDFPNVDLVVHAQVPRSLQTFVHRSGRTARGAQCKGTVITLAQKEEVERYNKITKGLVVQPLSSSPIGAMNYDASQVHDIAEKAEYIESQQFRLTKTLKAREWKKKALEEAELVDSDIEQEEFLLRKNGTKANLTHSEYSQMQELNKEKAILDRLKSADLLLLNNKMSSETKRT